MSQTDDARNAHRYYLGVDGGGTKTAFAVASTDGGLLGEVTGEGTDYAARGLAAVERTLHAGIEEVCRRAGIAVSEVTGAIFGLPGHGEDPVGTAELDRLGARLVPEGRGRCVNDVVCGWAGSLGLEDGIDVVAGTGSVAYGQRLGAGARAGGWGEIIGDEGSAYWIGRQCLNLFARMSDGRAPRGPLYALIRAEASVHTADLELVPQFAAGEASLRRRVAAFAPLAAVAAEAGDTESFGILTRAGRELALLALTVAGRLGFPADAPTRVSYSGSVFGSTALLEAFTSRLAEDERAVALQPPVMSPVLGAVAYAARENGDDIDLAAVPGRQARVT